MPDGRRVTCVEKVFAPGRLTRTIYRLSFQSPFAYQSNRNAILTCFYRRRVAAAVLAGSDIDASIASPLYVRFDETDRAWVLAAQWIDGRGIKPAASDASRLRRRFIAGDQKSQLDAPQDEIDQLVETMRQLETMLGDCGLVGSGWQVAPRALVSTANLLRTGNRYTIIDLESGIPAVLVPRYLIAGVCQAALPPFDDLETDKLRTWIEQNERLLTFRIGLDALHRLCADSDKLIEHSTLWKDSELALFRRPWRLLTRRGSRAYQQECIRRWQQDGIVDGDTASALPARPIQSRLIWYTGLLPSSVGRFCSRLIGRKDYREHMTQCLRSSASRADQWQRLVQRCQSRWTQSGRIAPSTTLNKATFLPNLVLKTFTPTRLHRFFTDGRKRRDAATSLLLLMFSSRYQSWFGRNRIEASIDRWRDSQRISEEEANGLRQDLCGSEVRAYTRGFGMHVALKASAPIIAPAKVGGVAAFVASGNLWFLLPMLATPLMRTAVTLANWWTTRHQHIPHTEALAMGLLPVVGSVAYPLQMFATRPKLSTFLIRDAASRLGQRLPIYGGADSRTEIAMIRATDYVVEVMQSMSLLTQRLFGTHRDSTAETLSLRIHPRTRFGRWIDRKVSQQINEAEQEVQFDNDLASQRKTA